MEKLAYRSGKELKNVWSEVESKKISALMNMKYRTLLDKEQFQVFYPIELIHVIENREEQPPQTADEIASLMLDYIDVYWQEYLNDGRDVFVPLAWGKHVCEGVEFFIRGFVRNRSLEEQADELFKKHGHGEHEIEPISDEL